MFYDRVNELCKQNNTTISVFTREVLGLNSSSATGWKKGASPSSDVVIKAARYFDVSTDYLLGIDESLGGESVSFSDEEIELILELRSADPKARAAAIASMKAILSLFAAGQSHVASYHSSREDNTDNRGAV